MATTSGNASVLTPKEDNIPGRHVPIVHIDVDTVSAGRRLQAFFKAGQIRD